MSAQYVDIVFDGPPGHCSGRFVEVEDHTGRSINFGRWLQRADGYWVLRLDNIRAELQRKTSSIAVHTRQTSDDDGVFCK